MSHETHSADHRCPSRPVCFIVPPDPLANVIEEGDPEQREAALRDDRRVGRAAHPARRRLDA